LIFERAHHLPPVLERVGVLNANLEGELGYGHGLFELSRTVYAGMEQPGGFFLAIR